MSVVLLMLHLHLHTQCVAYFVIHGGIFFVCVFIKTNATPQILSRCCGLEELLFMSLEELR